MYVLLDDNKCVGKKREIIFLNFYINLSYLSTSIYNDSQYCLNLLLTVHFTIVL